METFAEFRAELKRSGVELVSLPGEVTVRDLAGGQTEAFETLGEGVARGREIAASRPWVPTRVGTRRGKRFWLLPPKARIKARIRAHNRRMARRERQSLDSRKSSGGVPLDGRQRP